MTRRKLNIDRAIKIGGYYSLECSSDEEGLGFVRSCVDERERETVVMIVELVRVAERERPL